MKKMVFALISLFILINSLNAAAVVVPREAHTPPHQLDVISECDATKEIVAGINDLLDSGDLDPAGESCQDLNNEQINCIRYMVDLEVFHHFGRKGALTTLNRDFLLEEDVDIDDFVESIRGHMLVLKDHLDALRRLANLPEETFVASSRAFFADKIPAEDKHQERLAFAIALVGFHERFYDAF